MCGRYAFEPDDRLYSEFNTSNPNNLKLPLSFNVTPGNLMPVITADAGVRLMKWGLVPFWATDPRIGFRLINARSESVATKPAFRTAFNTKRCIVPATGFYEWQKTNGKTPYYFYSTDHKYLGLAGIYDVWTDAEGKQINSFAIITTPANHVVAPVHDRMPAIIMPGHEGFWLDQETKPSTAQSMLKPFAGSISTRQVSPM